MTAHPLDAEVGHILRLWRSNRRLSKGDVVDLLRPLGVDWSTYTLSHVERGKRGVRLHEFFAIVAVTGLSPEHLARPFYRPGMSAT